MSDELSKITTLLQQRTPPGEILWRPGSLRKDKDGKPFKIQVMPYIDGVYVERVLDRAVGPFGWQRRHRKEGDTYICGIAIKDPTTGEWVWKEDGAGATDFEGEKGGLTDSFKRAARTGWGIGRDLVDIGEKWAELAPAGAGKRAPGPDWEWCKTKEGPFYFRRPMAGGKPAAPPEPEEPESTPQPPPPQQQTPPPPTEKVSPGKPEQGALPMPEEPRTEAVKSPPAAKPQQQRQKPEPTQQVRMQLAWGELLTKATMVSGSPKSELVEKVKALRETAILATLPEADAFEKAKAAIERAEKVKQETPA